VKQNRSSVTEVSFPGCETKYREPDDSAIDISKIAAMPALAFLHPRAWGARTLMLYSRSLPYSITVSGAGGVVARALLQVALQLFILSQPRPSYL
jgi:hypothetical protein